jgi:hypothetical protein
MYEANGTVFRMLAFPHKAKCDIHEIVAIRGIK